MKMELDANSRNWLAQASQFANIVEDEVNTTAREIAETYYSLTEKNTPVDVDGDHPGKMKAGWKVQTRRLGRRGRLVELSNDVNYMPAVEYGHRIVRNGKVVGFAKGRFFVKRARKRTTQKEIPKAYKAMDKRIKRRSGFD